MKKIYVFFVMLLLANVENGNAQKNSTDDNSPGRTTSREARRKFLFGFKAGFNRSNVYNQNNRTFVANPKTGGVGGVFFAIPFGDFIGFQPEVLYSQKGFSGAGQLNGDVYTLNRTTSYLDIPLQLQLKPFSWMSMVAGLQYSYLLKQHDEFSHGNNYEYVNQTFSNDNIRKNLVGFVMGGDLNFWHIVFSGRAGWDMIANHGDGNSSTPQYKNLWFQGTVGYRIY
jgi:hypothetical protein